MPRVANLVIEPARVDRFSCVWALEATLHGTRRDDPPDGFAAALEARIAADPTCTGCVLSGPFAAAMRPYCLYDCLTECEVDVIAELDLAAHDELGAFALPMAATKEEFVNEARSASSWICRGQWDGTSARRA